MPLHFDPDDNDDHQMKQLDERKASAFLGGAYYHHESWGSLKVAVSGDATDESGGMIGEVSYFRPIRMERLTLTPSVGVFIPTKAITTTTTAYPATSLAAQV